MRLAASVLPLTLTLFAIRTAAAQSSPQPATDPQTQPATPTAPPVATAPAAPAPRVVGEEEEPEEKVRFRWGISGMGGRYFYAGSGGGVGGIDARFGAQITNMIGVYGQPVVQIGAGYSSGSDSASASVIALAGLGALVDFTFLDLIYVAIGPEYTSIGGGNASVSTTSASSSAIAGNYLSIAGRAGVALGSIKPDRRKAFTIGLDLRAVLASDAVIIPCLALGYDSF